jgi:hypothetical protein
MGARSLGRSFSFFIVILSSVLVTANDNIADRVARAGLGGDNLVLFLLVVTAVGVCVSTVFDGI